MSATAPAPSAWSLFGGAADPRPLRRKRTAAGTRCRHNPHALRQHVVARLPLGTKEFDRHAGWLALAVAGSGVPAETWRDEISSLLLDLGWRTNRDRYSPPPANNPTLVVLDQLAGTARTGWRVTGTNLAVASTARAATRRT